jgi:hypothetical protein
VSLVSAGAADDTRLVLDAHDTPFVVYRDFANGGKATLKTYTGSSWEEVGVAGLSAGEAGSICLQLDGAGTPYIAYQDGQEPGRTVVMKLTGSGWADVGTAGFAADALSLALDAAGTPLVAFANGDQGWKATVIKCTGNAAATGVGQSPLAASFSVFPNPAKDYLQVLLSLPQSTDLELKLLDVQGQVVLEESYPQAAGAFKQILPLKALAPGVYLLQLVTEKETIAQRVVVE